MVYRSEPTFLLISPSIKIPGRTLQGPKHFTWSTRMDAQLWLTVFAATCGACGAGALDLLVRAFFRV